VNNGCFNTDTGREAGKRSKRGVGERTKILNELFDGDKAKTIFHKLEDLATEGNMDAIKTYLAYCFGKPESKLDITSDGEQIAPDMSRLTTEQLNYLRSIRETLEYK